MQSRSRRHDVGYRNLGRGLRLRPTEAARLTVDRRLLTELRRVCAERFAALEALRCRLRARAMYTAVRLFNPPWTSIGAQTLALRVVCAAAALPTPRVPEKTVGQ